MTYDVMYSFTLTYVPFDAKINQYYDVVFYASFVETHK